MTDAELERIGIIFEEGIYQRKLNVFENLEWNGINVPKEMRLYPYFIYKQPERISLWKS